MATATTAPDPIVATVTPTPTPEPETPPQLYRISLDLYNQMIELGLLGPRDPIELLDGLLVKKMPNGPRHFTATRRAYTALMARLSAGWHRRLDAPVGLPQGPDGDSTPEPDVVIVRGDDELYSRRHPGPGDVILVIQVADSPVASDRRALRRFGWAGIPCVWIVNLRNRTIEVYTGPSGPGEDPGFAEKGTKGQDDTLLITLEDGSSIQLPVSNLLT